MACLYVKPYVRAQTGYCSKKPYRYLIYFFLEKGGTQKTV